MIEGGGEAKWDWDAKIEKHQNVRKGVEASGLVYRRGEVSSERRAIRCGTWRLMAATLQAPLPYWVQWTWLLPTAKEHASGVTTKTPCALHFLLRCLREIFKNKGKKRRIFFEKELPNLKKCVWKYLLWLTRKIL